MGIGTGTVAVMEGIHASVAGLDALFVEDAALVSGAGAGGAGAVVDVLQRQYEIRLDRMATVKQFEAQLAAIKARDAAEAVEIQHAMTPPKAPVHERTYAEMSAVEEIAGVLTISSPAAGALVTQSRQLTSLPPAMDALSAGAISWQHAKIIADETEGLGPAGAAALVEHVLNPNPVRGAAAGELVPSRFRTRVRNWRERHHPETLEKRHTKSAADRRMEYTPDRDGMAWLSLYLPADTASAIWNRSTALARGLQGPEEPRTMTQLRPDIAAHLLLAAGPALSPAPESTAAELSTNKSSAGEANTETTEDGSHNPIGRASLAAADANETATASTGHEETDGSAYTDLANVPVPKVDVLVTVPVFALLGLTDEPANLDGYGPIPASMARKLVTDGASSFYRVLVDPRDGAPLEIGRTNYRLTKAMKQASAFGTENAPSPAATTTPSTTTPTTSPPGTTAEPPESATSHSSAPNTTASNTPPAGNPPQPPTTNHPAGPHPPAATTNPNNPTPNHHNGRRSCMPSGNPSKRPPSTHPGRSRPPWSRLTVTSWTLSLRLENPTMTVLWIRATSRSTILHGTTSTPRPRNSLRTRFPTGTSGSANPSRSPEACCPWPFALNPNPQSRSTRTA
jgi:hypothetical protein